MSEAIPLLTGGRRANHSGVREAAVWAFERTLHSIAPAETYLAAARGRCDERDHALLHELVLGTLRWLRRLDHVIAIAADRPLDKIEPALLSTLRMGVYQLLFLDRVPDHAVVNEAVEQARWRSHRGGGNFVNAVLRRVARSRLDDFPVAIGDPVARMAIELSHPEFLVRRWVGRYGETATRQLLEANNRAKPVHLLAFRDRGGRERVAEELIDEGLEIEPSDVSPLGLKVRSGRPWNTAAFQRGDLYVQDEVSQMAALIPLPTPGGRVLDVAAAPGGKTFALLACEPSLRCVASDVSVPRMARMHSNLRRLGRELPLVVADAALPGISGEFDRVVVDLPCSGTGTLRSKPELKWRVSEAEIERLSDLGLEVLAGAARPVGPGGLLVAITCSLEPEENESVVERFVSENHDFSRLDLGSVLAPALAARLEAPGLWRQPTADDHDGFTVQVLERRAPRAANARAPSIDKLAGVPYFPDGSVTDKRRVLMAGKADIVDSIATRVEGLTKKQAADAFDEVMAAITRLLKNGERVQLPGFGSLSVASRPSRMGRNPKTGAAIHIAASKAVKFKVGKELKDALN